MATISPYDNSSNLTDSDLATESFNNVTLTMEDNPKDHEFPDDTVTVVLIPLAIIAFLIIIAAIIFCIIRKRSAQQQRQQFVPMYTVEHEEAGNEWESQLLDDEVNKHTQIVKPNRENEAKLYLDKSGP